MAAIRFQSVGVTKVFALPPISTLANSDGWR